jgi:hypothetical protein
MGDKMLEDIKPIPAIHVVNAVVHALTARKPKCVYIVGKDAKQAYCFSRLPKRLFNWLFLKHINKMSK